MVTKAAMMERMRLETKADMERMRLGMERMFGVTRTISLFTPLINFYNTFVVKK
jgi:hypothetical protein